MSAAPHPALTAICAAAAFFIGSIPFGVIVSRLFFGTDLRASGSGNIGAANALRSLGAKGGAAVLALDALKGFIPTYAAALLVPPLGIAAVAAIAFATIAGHCYSPWLRFAGGKGVATLLGALLALWCPAGLILIAAWFAVFRLTGFASAASLTGTFCALVALSVHDRSPAIAAFGVLTMVLIAWKHRANIERLRAGTENKLSLTRRPTGTQGHG